MRGERGGIAILMLLAFMVLAVPITLGTLRTAGQLARNSRVYDDRLIRFYSAGAGIEFALWQMLNDPTFDDGLTAENPTQDEIVTSNGETITVTVTKMFSGDDIQGQAIVATKSVDPATAQIGQPTTFTYTVTIRNAGTGTVQIKQLQDYLPPGFTYVSGSTNGLSTTEPSITTNAPATCGSVPSELRWNIQPEKETVNSGQEVTLTFQATATLADGTYYNQTSVRYDPWWASPDTYVYTPHTAGVTVGTGTPKCGYNLRVLVTKEVEPAVPPPGVETEFTYTITVENVSSGTLYVCKIEDLLPPTFTYVAGSSGEYASNITTAEPLVSWESGPERWNLRWADGFDTSLEPMTSIPVDGTKTQTFRATAIPASGADYFNEVNVTWASSLTGGGKCKGGQAGGGTSYGGAGQLSAVDAPIMYDLSSVASDGSIQSRVVFYELAGQIEILSWQQY